MPKINVYLPDDLATAVREAGIPVSPVCQKALSEAVRLVGRARKTAERLRDPSFDPATVPQIGSRIGRLMTPRLTDAVALAREVAGPATPVDSAHLLIGLLDEGDNLGIRLLQALDVDVDELREAAVQLGPDVGALAKPDNPAEVEAEAGPGRAGSFWTWLSFPARAAIAATIEASVDLGHNYLGCEHLLLGLVAGEDDGVARLLRSFGVDGASGRRAVTTAIAGFAHARASSATADAGKLDEIIRRLEAVESRLGPAA